MKTTASRRGIATSLKKDGIRYRYQVATEIFINITVHPIIPPDAAQ